MTIIPDTIIADDPVRNKALVDILNEIDRRLDDVKIVESDPASQPRMPTILFNRHTKKLWISDTSTWEIINKTPTATDLSGYSTTEEITAELDDKSNTNHNHDSRYYAEGETDALLDDKSDTTHLHDGRYYTETESNDLLDDKSDTTHLHDARYYKSADDAEFNTVEVGGGYGSTGVTISDAGSISVDGRINVGTNDAVRGEIRLYGKGAGNADGGRAFFYIAADHDTSIDAYIIQTNEDDLFIGPSADSNNLVLDGPAGTFTNTRGKFADGSCEIYTGDAIGIINDLLTPGSGKFDKYGREKFDFKRLHTKYPDLMYELDGEYYEYLGPKADVAYRAIQQLAERIEELEIQVATFEQISK